MLDVVEHVEDNYSFLRDIQTKSHYKIVHVPLELSVQKLIRYGPLLTSREKFGHLHFFTKEIILKLLNEADYEVIDYFYTGSSVDDTSKSPMLKIAKWPRKFLYALNNDLAVRYLGGYSIMILAK